MRNIVWDVTKWQTTITGNSNSNSNNENKNLIHVWFGWWVCSEFIDNLVLWFILLWFLVRFSFSSLAQQWRNYYKKICMGVCVCVCQAPYDDSGD